MSALSLTNYLYALYLMYSLILVHYFIVLKANRNDFLVIVINFPLYLLEVMNDYDNYRTKIIQQSELQVIGQEFLSKSRTSFLWQYKNSPTLFATILAQILVLSASIMNIFPVP